MHLFVNQLCNVDFSYLDEARGVVGETWLASIELHGSLDEQGMVLDFGRVKKMMRTWLDETIDHKLLIPAQAKSLQYTRDKEQERYYFDTQLGIFSGSGPAQAHCHIDAESINPDSVAAWCIEQLRAHFPKSISKLKLSFTPEAIEGPYYHYTHGLQKHDGNCQRIAHGHRSKIEIWKDGHLNHRLMAEQAELWRDIYIGTRGDLDHPGSTDNNYAFRYTSGQGEFAISVPKKKCYLIDQYSTVEYIAEHIAKTLKQASPTSEFRVCAYEGIGKGAIIES